MNNTKYFPCSGPNTNNMLNYYVKSNDKITFPKIISKTKYNTTYNKPQVFKYTNQDYEKSLYDKKSNPINTLIGYYRPIITAQTNIHEMYNHEKKIDEYLTNDPINDVYMHPNSIKNEIATFPSVKKPVINTLLKNDK